MRSQLPVLTLPALEDAGGVTYVRGAMVGGQAVGRGQVRLHLFGVGALRAAVAVSALAPEPAVGPTEVLASVTPGQKLTFGGGVGRRPEGSRSLLLVSGEGEALQGFCGVRQGRAHGAEWGGARSKVVVEVRLCGDRYHGEFFGRTDTIKETEKTAPETMTSLTCPEPKICS